MSTSNEAGLFKNSQFGIANQMQYTVLFSSSTSKATVASLAAKLYTASTELMTSILEVYDSIQNSQSNEDKVGNALAKLEVVKNGFKDFFTERSDNEVIRTYLRREAVSADGQEQSVTNRMTIPTPVTACSLEKGTPVFHGRKEEVITNWLIVINNKLVTSKIPDESKISCVLPFLKDTALDVAVNYVANHGYDSWSNFERLLLRTFEPIDLQRRLRLQLKNLTQTGKIDEFNKQFMLLSNRITTLSEADKLLWYVESLKGRIRYEVNAKSPATLDEAMVVATNFETLTSDNVHEMHMLKTNKVKKITKSNDSNQLKCYSCGKIGHRAKECKSNPPSKSRDISNKKAVSSKANIKCFKCDKQGHYANECRSAKKKIQINTAVVKDIYAVASESDDLLVLENVVLELKNQEVSAHALLDTGSSVCALSKAFAWMNKIPYTPSKSYIHTVIGEGKVVGKTDPLIVKVMDKYECKVSFYVIDTDYEVILGANYFKSMNCSIGYKNAEPVISFNDDKYYLHSMKQVEEEPCIHCYSTLIDSVGEASNVDEDDNEFDDEWVLVKEVKVKADSNLSESDQKEFDLIVDDIKSVIASELTDLGRTNLAEHHITMIDNTPTYVAPYRQSAREREIIQQEVNELERAGIVSQSRSPNCAPISLVAKKDGGRRIVLNYKQLNKKMKTELWPLPRIDDILDKLSNSRFFTKLDLKSGYYQIPLSKESKKLTSFMTSDGAYEFNVVPFGLKNAPFEFSRIMKQLFGDLSYVEVFIDDITIHDNNLKQHFMHIREVLKRLRDANMKINLSKCIFITTSIRILGHIIENNQIKMDDGKIDAIRDRSVPNNAKQLQRYLGLCNYYRKFISGFANISKPLFQLLGKDTKWHWSAECQKAFDNLKNALTSYPILRAPNFNAKFIIHTDASHYAIGAILSQIDDKNNEYVVCYASRLLKNSEINYNISEKECLAVLWSIKQFRAYIFGTIFDVVTDHSALKWLLTIKDPLGRLARWSLYLQTYTFNIIHRRGIKHTNVDALSRPLNNIQIEHEKEEETETELSHEPHENEHLIHYLKFKRHIDGASKGQIKRTLKLASKFKLDGENLLIQPKSNEAFKIYPKLDERVEIINKHHHLGHFKAASTYAKIRETHFWRKMFDQIVQVVNKCLVCQRNDRINPMHHPALTLEVTGIFDRVGMDLVFGLPTTVEGYKGLLVLTEYLSQFAFIFPIKSKSAEEIAIHLLSYISIFSPPRAILSDLGTEFNNEIVNRLLSNNGVEHLVTSGWSPETNGKVERLNATLVTCLRKHAEQNTSIWPEYLPMVMLAYNSRIHSTTGFTPFELVFGRKMNTFENWSTKKPIEDVMALRNRADQIQALINEKHQKAIVQIKEKQEVQKVIQDSHHKVLNKDLQPGTLVMVKREGLLKKLEPRYAGLFKIIRKTKKNNYVLEDTNDKKSIQTVPIDKLKIVEREQDDYETSAEVEVILEKRSRNNVNEYLVRWKADQTTSWVKESDFNSMELINQFNSNHIPKRRGRPPKIKINHLILMSLCTIFFQPIDSFRIRKSFSYCDLTGDVGYYDGYASCGKTTGNFTASTKYTLFSKLHDIVNGDGNQCFKTKHFYKFNEDFLGYRSDSRADEPIALSRRECLNMIESKMCNEKSMTCENNQCWYQPQVTPVYSWFNTNEVTVYSCSYNTKPIIAHDLNSHLFGTRCVATDEECRLHDSLIIWNKSIIHDCPFNRIETFDFNISGNLAINEANHILLQLKGVEQHCGLSFLTTEEGIYLLNHNQLTDRTQTQLEKMFPKIDQKALTDLQLADVDFSSFKLIQQELAVKSNLCYMFVSLLNLVKTIPNHFIRLFDSSGQLIIVYNRNGDIIVPNCQYVYEIEVLEETSNCYVEFPVRFKLNNKTVIGFLTEDIVIQEYSSTIECTNASKSIYFPTLNMRIIRNGNKVIKKYEPNRKTNINFKQRNFGKLNFHHSALLVNGIDTISEFIKLTQVKEKDEVVVVVDDKEHNTHDYEIKKTHKRSNLINYILKISAIFGSSISAVVVIVLAIIFRNPLRKVLKCYMRCRKVNKSNKKLNTSTEPQVEIEMQALSNQNEEVLPSTSNTIDEVAVLRSLLAKN